MKHLLTIENLSPAEINEILALSSTVKARRGQENHLPLKGQTWGLLFAKASTRTRVSFEVGIRELGGSSLYLSNNDIQLGRGETVADTARVLSRYLHGVTIRTFAQSDVEEFALCGSIPVINALTDDEHPCQILADLLTVKEALGGWEGKKIAFIGDGFSNMTISWMWAAKKLGFELAVAAPAEYQPPASFLEKLGAPNVTVTTDPVLAAQGAHVINTDVWLSMGQEGQQEKEEAFGPFQVNADLVAHAAPDHIVLHCLPAYRGKEITEEVLEKHADIIFQEAENRLHAQKAILVALAK
jgi:ornithine carbamoyltransferase